VQASEQHLDVERAQRRNDGQQVSANGRRVEACPCDVVQPHQQCHHIDLIG